MEIILGLIIIPVLLIVVIGGVYNGLVRARNSNKEGWSGIDVQLKRRYDLIPNLVETVKGYAGHEQEVLENVTSARAGAQSVQGQSIAQRAEAEGQLTTALRGLFAVAENYPDLKANQNFLALQGSLTEIENDLQMARRYYNGTTRDLNNKVEGFPSNIIAGMFGFKTAEFFEIENDAEREAPKVSFS